MSDIDFRDYCPDENYDRFNRASNDFVREYREGLLPQGIVKSEIDHLRKSLKGLSRQTRKILIRRECSMHKDNDREYMRIIRGGSAVALLEELAREDFEYSPRKDAKENIQLIQWAELCFKAHGGKIVASPKAAFVGYVSALVEESGKRKDFDAYQAIRKYLKD